MSECDDGGLKGIGLSDAYPLQKAMVRFPGYQNTYYHKDPMLDIMTAPVEAAQYDYLISSDVFEHTPPPVEEPFKNAFSYLKPGGKFVLSVPTQPKGKEHFPNLNDYQIVETGGDYILANATNDAKLEIYQDLVFHGGPGSTLEMRIFTIAQVETLLKQAGFSKIERIELVDEAFGISDIKGLSSFWVATK